MGDLLEELVKHKIVGATAFAASLTSLPLPSEGAERERALVAARVLLLHAEDAGWATIWPAIQRDTAFGRELIEGVVFRSRLGTENLGQQLTEEQLAELYIWLAREYPHAEDPQFDGMHAVDTREQVAHWRDAVLQHLKERGTERAVAAIQRLIPALPELGWLKWTLLDAQTITRRRTWTPAEPAHILAVAADHQKRLVQDGEQLLDVIEESLRRLEAKLHGETPMVISLWNEWKQDGKVLYHPKDEERLSDYIKAHLDEDLRGRGIIANREVKIRQGEGSSAGQRTDIHVDAIRRGKQSNEDYDTITVIIEAKGCWHRQLFHAMEEQLVNRYLQDNQVRHGLYLVGWYNCKQWDKGDDRERRAPKISVADAQQRFDVQAAELSSQGRHIRALVLDTGLR